MHLVLLLLLPNICNCTLNECSWRDLPCRTVVGFLSQGFAVGPFFSIKKTLRNVLVTMTLVFNFKWLKFSYSSWKLSSLYIYIIFLTEQMANFNQQCWTPNSWDTNTNKDHTVVPKWRWNDVKYKITSNTHVVQAQAVVLPAYGCDALPVGIKCINMQTKPECNRKSWPRFPSCLENKTT